MKNPYDKTGGFEKRDRDVMEEILGFDFEGGTPREADVLRQTEKVLDEDSYVAVITRDGRIVPKNRAFKEGEKNPTELYKERVWGDGSSAEEVGDEPVSLSFDPLAWETVMREAARDDDLETGGILVGTMERNGEEHWSIEVRRTCIRPAVRKYALYSPDLGYARNRVRYYREQKGWSYLGEWHRHPKGMRCLSRVDREMAKELLLEEGHPALLLPVATREDGVVRLDVYFATLNADESRSLNLRRIWTASEEAGSIGKGDLTMNRLYINRDWITDFVRGEARSVQYEGRWNRDRSFVFLPLPGEGNARLTLVRPNGETPVSNRSDQVTGILAPDDTMRFYGVEEGEVREFSPIYISPGEDVYSRNEGLLETTELKDRTVLMVGCGSLGSAMALELARAGVGTIHLMDPDLLEPHNVSRHQCGLGDLGRPKVEALRDRISEVCPGIRTLSHQVDVVEDPDVMSHVGEIASDCDLLICTTDTDSSRVFVNDLTLNQGVPSLQVGLHSRAQSGIIQAVRPERGACFLCHRRMILDQEAQHNPGVAYSEAQDLTDITIQPGLSAQIGLVAEAGVVRAIDLLCRDGEEDQALPDLTLVEVSHADDRAMGRPLLRFRHLEVEPATDCCACGGRQEPDQDAKVWE